VDHGDPVAMGSVDAMSWLITRCHGRGTRGAIRSEEIMRPSCACELHAHRPCRIVLTGGPGAGKTAVLEVVQRQFCEHVVALPEAASILFKGGFPRRSSTAGREAVQRAIFRIQTELERMTLEESRAAVILCDRGTVDCLAYWDAAPARFWQELGTSHAAELARYAAVIHLRPGQGYDHSNPMRIETAEQALAIDRRIEEVWAPHPSRVIIDSSASFLDKLDAAIGAIRAQIPSCCLPEAATVGS
jgi:predicted ATPase